MAKKTKPRIGNGAGAAKSGAANGMLEKIQSVYEFMTKNNLESLEIDEPGRHVRLVRRKAAASVPVPVPVAAGASVPPASQPAPAAAAAAPAVPAGGLTVKASMMGIFYRAPSPSSPPYLKEGDQVAE
ncbi:MAG: hypothetical protein KGI84_07490, partial [Elusimicrobia bacterium]|nr:hypothetical protein [Elusimicrobiota bacterium]